MGSISICVNSLTGPAMVNLPASYQRAGLIPTTACLLFACVLSALSSLHMADVISKIPGNESFQRAIGFSQSFQIFWGRKWFLFTQVAFFCCIQCLNISSMVDTAQVLDNILGYALNGGSLGLFFSSKQAVEWIRWDPSSDCIQDDVNNGKCIPFFKSNNNVGEGEDEGVVLTLGYIVVFVVLCPLCLMDLKENADSQIFGFLVLLVVSMGFIVSFLQNELNFDNVSWWGTSWSSLFGVVMFNFSLVLAIPTWLHEKKSSVCVSKAIHYSYSLSTSLYILVGILGAMCMSNVSDNMLESMMSGNFGIWMQLASCIFALLIVGLGIPLFCVLARANIMEGSNLCPVMGNVLGVYFPWAISWLFYRGSAITGLLSWGGILFTSAVAFILPILLALYTLRKYGNVQGSISIYGNWIRSKNQEEIVLHILLFVVFASTALATRRLLI